MQPTLVSRLAPIGRIAMAAALLAGGSAFAGTFMGEAGFGYGSGGKISKGSDEEHGSALLLDGAFGYRFDTGFGARALFIADVDPWRGFLATDRSFNTFYGVQATAYVPIVEKLNLMGGLGLGQSSLNRGGFEAGHDEATDGVVSAGLQFHVVRNFSMELHVDYLTKTHVSNTALMFQVPF